MNNPLVNTTVLVTGSAGFIGFHLSKRLLDMGATVVGLDALTDYYDVRLKRSRNAMLQTHKRYRFANVMLEDETSLKNLFEEHSPAAVVHLAAQAGVRYSIENPRSYVDSNLVGTFNIMECARQFSIEHLMLASTSSAYGANEDMPWLETDQCDHQMSFYAATKRANEAMSHSYAHLFDIPTTVFRFFTVYGPWGRPDMALFKFTDAILQGRAIDVYNHGNMRRDFTYVEDLVKAIEKLIFARPQRDNPIIGAEDSLSPVAPWRIVNVGNSDPLELSRFIEAIEESLGVVAQKNLLPMQAGDVPASWANTSLLNALIGFTPQTSVEDGVKEFIAWYRDYYNV